MINNTFSGLEMFKVAILMEEEGYDFYSNGVNYTTGKTKEFLLAAAGQEFIHKEKFTKLFNELITNKQSDSEYLFDTVVTKYLRNLIENQVFNKNDKPRDTFKDLKSALTYSLNAENLTISVYTQMYERASQKYVSEILSVILEEEKAHAAYFSKLLQEIIA
ncbi:ferritin-like domain-containing protein [Clostridium estertheticum]|uniref:ferritin family protein n=1 Tax=Clostridium estertheticum TaxID=238834 RepID=UPI001CD05B00|nr:ferritin family protein [Clostridium estertheticum]MBZ9687849.1 ferritin-like domain-containing protein [Clostridium estertheticum]